MSLQKNNKYKGKIAVGISAMALVSTLTGCISAGIPANAMNLEVSPTPEVQIVEPTTPVEEQYGDEPFVTPEPTEVPIYVNEEYERMYKLLHFSPLSEEEYAEAIQKIDSRYFDEKLKGCSLTTVGLLVNGEPRIAFGVAEATPKANEYVFYDLWGAGALFTYNTGDFKYPGIVYGTHGGFLEYRVENTPLHPYFENDDVEMVFIGTQEEAYIFMKCYMYDTDANMDYIKSVMPACDSEYCRVEDFAYGYLNVIPKEFWVTSEDLELALDAKQKEIN